MRHIITNLVLLFGLSATLHASDPKPVSIIQLLASPERFNSQRVIVRGFANLAFEGNALYLHKEDFDHGLTNNALRLAVPRDGAEKWKALSGRYVIVTARFVWGPGDDIVGGMLVDITRFEEWPPEPAK